jgi:hypothetical protein
MSRRTSLLFPRGTCKTPRFFNRDDEFKEEQTEDAPLQSELASAKRELEQAREEFRQAQTHLNDRDSLCASIADSIGHNDQCTPEHAELRRRIAALAIDIEETEHQIAEARAHTDPSMIAQLERERSDYLRHVESLDRELFETQERIKHTQLELFRLFASEDWRTASAMAAERQITSRILERSRTNVDKALEVQTPRAPSNPPRKVVDVEIQRLLEQRKLLDQQCQKAVQQRWCAQIRRRVKVASLLDDLTSLDAALRALGDEGFDVGGLRMKYLPEGPLTPLKQRAQTASGERVKKGLAAFETGRSKSDLKRPIRGRRLE